jgi:hypothetical protein
MRQQRATDLHAERTSHLGRLAEVRRRRYRLVHEAARQLNTALGPRVRLKVYALADRMGFQEALEDAVRGQNVRSEQIARLAAVRSRAWFDARCGRLIE